MNANEAARRIQAMWRKRTVVDSNTGQRFPKMFEVSPLSAPALTFDARSLQRHIHSYDKHKQVKWPLHEPISIRTQVVRVADADPPPGRRDSRVGSKGVFMIRRFWGGQGGGGMSGFNRRRIAKKAMSLQARLSEEMAPLAMEALVGTSARSEARKALADQGLVALRVNTLDSSFESITIKRNAGVQTLKRVVGEVTGQHARSFGLVHAGRQLDVGQLRRDNNVQFGDTIHMVRRGQEFHDRPFGYDPEAQAQRLQRQRETELAASRIQSAFRRKKNDPHTNLGLRRILRQGGFDPSDPATMNLGRIGVGGAAR